MAVGSLGWYLRRLRVMSPAEWLHRVLEQGSVLILRVRTALDLPLTAPGPAPAAFRFCTSAEPQLSPSIPWHRTGIDVPDPDLLAGHWPALGFHWQWAPGGESWHRAPDAGRSWPQTFFATIDYRTGNPVGDARVAWEPARLQQLVCLALVARRTSGESAAAAIALLEAQLADFVAANPPAVGIHYLSAMECALRLLAVCHAVDLCRGQWQQPDTVSAAVVALVRSHAPFIARRLSLHSSAGNHTIAEAAGLVYAGLLFPEFHDARRWVRRGLDLITREADRQILPDGGGIEQAFWYHLFVTDLCGLVVALLEHQGQVVPPPLAAAVARARLFLQTMARTPDRLPPVGDRDDGYALSAALAISFEPRLVAPPGPVVTFPDSGYSLARQGDVTLLFDHGPLGMAPAFGHGHADALAITLRYQQLDVLVDPGTFTYTGAPAWRRHFRGTAAHNTVTVAGADQSRQESAFMWSAPARARLLQSEERGGTVYLLGLHDGYRRLGDITHYRGLALRPDGSLLVWDRVAGGGDHAVALHWHTPLAVQASADGWRLGDRCMLRVSGAVGRTRTGGPPGQGGGWTAPVYGRRAPATEIRVEHQGPLPAEFVTEVWTGESPESGRSGIDLSVFRAWLE
jgi:Heparinase II/III-like protein/Heparinase II/III N-terminus